MENKTIAIINGEKRKKVSLLNILMEMSCNKEEKLLSEEEVMRLMEIGNLISREKKISLSFESLKNFLVRAMNYNKFQLEEDEETRFKEFLSVATDEEILALYDTLENYDEKNLASVDNLIAKSDITRTFGMQLNEQGNGVLPTITEESRKKVAKSLIR